MQQLIKIKLVINYHNYIVIITVSIIMCTYIIYNIYNYTTLETAGRLIRNLLFSLLYFYSTYSPLLECSL